jgi:D-3-phosphoglycerate dehydrogenase
MARYKVVMLRNMFPDTKIEEKAFKEIDVELVTAPKADEDTAVKYVADADAIIMPTKVTERILEAAKKCKIVAGIGVGYDNVDIVAAAKRGIYVTNMPAQHWCADEVSNHAISLGFAVQRKLASLNETTKNRAWREQLSNVSPIFSFRDQTWGLYACGHIARSVALKVQGFGFNVIAFDPIVSEEEAHQFGIKLVDFDTLLKTSDIISIHAPLLKSTFHAFNEEAFKKMKKTAYLINVGRGPIVDQKALYNALKAGDIAAAGLDVLEDEPPKPDEPLLTLDNIKLTVTPHMASYSESSFAKARKGSCEEVVRVLKGGEPKNCVNLKEMGK